MPDFFRLEVDQAVQSEPGTWYRVVQFLGAGGNAITYLVFCSQGVNKGSLFALKVFRVISKPERKVKFLKEGTFLRSTSHPSIMRVYDSGVFHQAGQEFPFTVSEYLPHTLREVIRARNCTMVRKISYSIQLLSALTYLTSLPVPVIHWDIKPDNIFVKGETCLLGDFGLMRFADEEDAVDKTVVRDAASAGMPFFYRTPDLIAYNRGEASLSTKSDVFQTALVLAELFSGRNPAKPPEDEDLTSPLELEPLGRIPGAMSGRIASLLNRMLTQDPNARPSAQDLMDSWCGLFQDAVRQAHDLDGRAF